MNTTMTSSNSRILSLVAATLIALYASKATAEDRVSINRHSFNPSLDETVAITVRTPAASRVSIVVVDRDGFVTCWLAKNEPSAASYVATWDGRNADGAVVAD